MVKDEKNGKGQEKAVTKQIANYLFAGPKSDDAGHEFLDIRTDINTKEMYAAISYYRILGKYFKCEAASGIASILERLNISSNREGRKEAVLSLMGNLATSKNVPTSLDEYVKKMVDAEKEKEEE